MHSTTFFILTQLYRLKGERIAYQTELLKAQELSGDRYFFDMLGEWITKVGKQYIEKNKKTAETETMEKSEVPINPTRPFLPSYSLQQSSFKESNKNDTKNSKCYLWLGTTNNKLSISIDSKNLKNFLFSANSENMVAHLSETEDEAKKKLHAKFNEKTRKRICKGFTFEFTLSKEKCNALFKAKKFDALKGSLRVIKKYTKDAVMEEIVKKTAALNI